MAFVDVIYFQIYEKDKYRPLDYFNNNTNKTDKNYTILNYHYDGTNLSVEVKKDIKFDIIEQNFDYFNGILKNKDDWFLKKKKKKIKTSVSVKSEGEHQPSRSSSSTFSQLSYKNEMFYIWLNSEAPRERISYQQFLNKILGETKKKDDVNQKHVEWLNSVPAEMGGPKNIRPNKGGGDCFFWAILHSLYDDNVDRVNEEMMKKLRTNVGDWVSENEQMLNTYTERGIRAWIDDSLTQYNDFENLVSDIKTQTVWVDNLVVQLTAEYLNTQNAKDDGWLSSSNQPIVVYIYSGKEGADELKLPNDETIGKTHLHLVYHSGVHYEGSVKKDNGNEDESSKN